MLLPAEKNKFRIALLGIYHESNTFVDGLTTINDFKKGRLLKGTKIINEYKDAHHELGGAIEVFTNNEVELLPVFYAENTPGALISETTYLELTDQMFRKLDAVLPLDACFVVPHGAAVAENHRDMDGDWLQLLRKKLGEKIPIVGTLDPHANVSEAMVNCTQGLFPYSTNPHIDQRETGRRAAQFLLKVLRQEIDPVQILFQAPVAMSIEQQYTSAEPCKSLYKFTETLCEIENALHLNIAIGFPYADVYELGTSVIIIVDKDWQKEASIKDQLEAYFKKEKQNFVGEKNTVDSQLLSICEKRKPVLLLDMGDNVGGGSNGNSTYLLQKLEETNYRSFICIYDPMAVKECLSRPSENFDLSFGINPETGNAYQTRVTLISTHHGKFREEQPRHGGQIHYDMGDTVIVVTGRGNTVMLHSKRIPPFSLAQLTSCGVNPATFDVLVAKGVNAPIAAYGPVCPTIIQADTPGVTQADMTKFNFKYRRKPLFPFEDITS
ncbi:MAG: M81 family metallopeptidase [Ginsengibacter sp.]